MAAGQLLFIPSGYSTTSKTDRKVALFAAKAHSARVGHANQEKLLSKGVQRSDDDKNENYRVAKHDDGLYGFKLPRVVLDNAREDPFQSLCVVLVAEEQKLLDIYLTTFQSKFYGWMSKPGPSGFNYFRDIVFPQAIRNPIVLRCAVLGIASHVKANFQESVQTISQDVQSLELMRAHFLRLPDDISDNAIIMCIYRSLFDDFQGRLGPSWIHMSKAMDMIRKRGGPGAFKDDYVMTCIVNNYLVRLPGYAKGDILVDDTPQTTSEFSFHSDRDIIEQVCSELIEFMIDAEELSNEHRRTALPYRRDMFGPRSALQKGVDAPYATIGSFPNLQLRATHGIGLLIYLNASLLDFRHDPTLSERFLKDLSNRMVESRLSTYRQLLISMGQFITYQSPHADLRQAQTQRLWKVGRMNSLAKRLSASSWQCLWENLLAYLTMQKPQRKMSDWADELRAEIMAAPPTKYVMDLLTKSGRSCIEVKR